MRRQPCWMMAVAVVAAVVLGSCGGSPASTSISNADGFAASGAATKAAVPAPAGEPTSSQEETRKIIVNSTMALEVKELRSSYLQAGVLVRSFGGFVADSTIDDAGGDSSAANMRLRVPSPRHDELIVSLRSLGGGRVLKESTTASEVTAQYTDLQSRLHNFQRSEAQYQELLKQAKTVDEILNVQTRLDSVRGQIEESQGRLNLLDSQVDDATISLSLSVPGASASEGISGPRGVFKEAWADAVIVSRLLLNLIVILVVAAIWLAIPALLVFLGLRFSARWRVKPALPPPSPPAE